MFEISKWDVLLYDAVLDDPTRLARPHPHARHLHARAETRKNVFSYSADYEPDCQPYPVDGYTRLNALTIHQSSKPFCYDERLVSCHVPVLYSNPNLFTLRSSIYDTMNELMQHGRQLSPQPNNACPGIPPSHWRPIGFATGTEITCVCALVSAKRLMICLVENMNILHETPKKPHFSSLV